jgi:hypothetical protein
MASAIFGGLRLCKISIEYCNRMRHTPQFVRFESPHQPNVQSTSPVGGSHRFGALLKSLAIACSPLNHWQHYLNKYSKKYPDPFWPIIKSPVYVPSQSGCNSHHKSVANAHILVIWVCLQIELEYIDFNHVVVLKKLNKMKHTISKILKSERIRD